MNEHNPIRQKIINEILSAGWVQSVHWFESIDSTNTAARRLIEAGDLPLPTLIVADRQTAGRGRSDHVWWSPEGCLMLTLIVPPTCLPDRQADWSQLSLVCGVAVADTAEAVAASTQNSAENHCQLKWPNDVYLGGRKVAGILIESVRLADNAVGWMIGIGLNVNMDWKQAPVELSAKGTCLTRATNSPQLPEVVLLELIEQLADWLTGWSTGQRHWLDGWRDRCLLTGKVVQIRVSHAKVGTQDAATIIGRCAGLDSHGRLLINTEQGMQPLTVGEVVHWQ